MFESLFGRPDGVNARVGTTAPVYIPRSADSKPVQPGEYFFMKIHSAQAAFRGTIFDQIKQLVVASHVNLNHPALGNEEVFALQRSRSVNRNRAEQLGLSQNLISMVPATMPHVTVSIDFILDKENSLAKLGGLINNDTFVAAVSLAPGAAAIAKTVGGLAQKVIQTFIPAEERQPILQFSGDFNLGASDLADGYYAILGSRSADDPIPTDLPGLEVVAGGLRVNGQELPNLSYIVLEVTRVPVRTREANSGALWDKKLREAEAVVQEVVDDPFSDDASKRKAWETCTGLLQDSRALLMADPNYAEAEAAAIYKTVFKRCADLVRGGPVPPVQQIPGGPHTLGLMGPERFEPDSAQARRALAIPLDEDIAGLAERYSQESAAVADLLKDAGFVTDAAEQP
jgi:hypothetical protein